MNWFRKTEGNEFNSITDLLAIVSMLNEASICNGRKHVQRSAPKVFNDLLNKMNEYGANMIYA